MHLNKALRQYEYVNLMNFKHAHTQLFTYGTKLFAWTGACYNGPTNYGKESAPWNTYVDRGGREREGEREEEDKLGEREGEVVGGESGGLYEESEIVREREGT